MDAVLRNFKQIPCPQGDKCTKPACQWQHSWDKKPEAASQVASAEQSGPSAAAAIRSQDGDEPRKRRKLSPQSESISPLTKPEAATGTRTNSISPPPLKRKVPASSSPIFNPFASQLKHTPKRAASISTSATATPFQVAASSSEQATPPPPLPQKEAVKPRKPEALNPRHLASASPAPHEFRFRALKMLNEQFKRLNNDLKKDAKNDEQKLVLTDQELIWMALDIEQKVAIEKPLVYQNVIKNHIMTYKKMNTGQWRDERLAEWKKKIADLAPRTPVRKSDLGPPKVIETGLAPREEVAFAVKFLQTPITELAGHGYVPVPPTAAEIKKAQEGEEAALGWEKCDRCSTRFQVFPGRREEDGALASGGECRYHHGRSYWPERAFRSVDPQDKKWRCCQEMVGDSVGCVTGPNHVFKASAPSRLAALIPFVETPPNPSAPKDRAICFDCEMGYTTRGMELLRLTATSWPDGKTVLDVLVRPLGEILDLNSRYSGIWPEDIVNAEEWSLDMPFPIPAEPEGSKKPKMVIVPSPMAARDLLFSLISPETPLIGHGLENDLNAVRIVHPTVIDTILLFPHKYPLPMRNGLRSLMAFHLNKRVQVEAVFTDMRGHDSAEDARSAGELVRFKVMEKWNEKKLNGWTCVDGDFVPPGGHKLSEEFLEEGEVGDEAPEVEEKIAVAAGEEYDPTRLCSS